MQHGARLAKEGGSKAIWRCPHTCIQKGLPYMRKIDKNAGYYFWVNDPSISRPMKMKSLTDGLGWH